jgi:hypothetical protein
MAYFHKVFTKELVKKEKESLGVEFSMRRFIELSTKPYDELIHQIDEILALTQSQRDKFPIPISPATAS